MKRQVVLWESFFDVIDMFSNANTEGSSGSAHILEVAWTFYDISDMGGVACYKFPNFIFFMVGP